MGFFDPPEEILRKEAEIEESIKRGWNRGDLASFENHEFTLRNREWRYGQSERTGLLHFVAGVNSEKLLDVLHFGMEILKDFGARKLAKIVVSHQKKQADCLDRIDFHNELCIWLFHNPFALLMLTNKAIYIEGGSRGKEVYRRVPYSELEQVEIKGVAFDELIINFSSMPYAIGYSERGVIKRLLQFILEASNECFEKRNKVTGGLMLGVESSAEEDLESLKLLKDLYKSKAITRKVYLVKREQIIKRMKNYSPELLGDL